MPPARHALVTLRTAVIGTVGALVAGCVVATAMMTGLGPVEILISTGTAFTGTVTFLNKVVE
jgi:ABC-type amino acid transport system permease subunit